MKYDLCIDIIALSESLRYKLKYFHYIQLILLEDRNNIWSVLLKIDQEQKNNTIQDPILRRTGRISSDKIKGNYLDM